MKDVNRLHGIFTRIGFAICPPLPSDLLPPHVFSPGVFCMQRCELPATPTCSFGYVLIILFNASGPLAVFKQLLAPLSPAPRPAHPDLPTQTPSLARRFMGTSGKAAHDGRTEGRDTAVYTRCAGFPLQVSSGRSTSEATTGRIYRKSHGAP